MRKPYYEAALVTGGAILFGLAFSYPILEHLSYTGGFYDWDLHLQLHWVAVDTVRRFHQLPLWNPYKCGGMPMLANPLSRIATPFFALSIVFGPIVGLNLEAPLHLAIGWSGGYVLARVLGLSATAAVACGSIFAGSSWFELHLGIGHLNFPCFVYMPWIVAMAQMSFTQRKLFPAAMGGALVALILGEGGVYAIPQVFMLTGLIGITLAILERRFWPVTVLLIFALFSAGFAAIKLFPTMRLMVSHPRAWNVSEATPLWLIVYGLLSRNQELSRPKPIGQWEYWEYGAYVGPFAVLLAGTGVLSSMRRALPWLIAGVIFLSLAMGEGGTWYPWTIVHRLPIFSSERAAPRFLIPSALVIGVLAAYGANFVQQRFKPWGSLAAYLLTLAMVLDLWLVCVPNLAHAVIGPVPATSIIREPLFRQNLNDSVLSTLPMTIANEGAINCYDYTDFRSNVAGFNGPGYHGEQYMLGPGKVRLIRWTPNALDYEVLTLDTNVLIVNQNYDPGWRLHEGRGEVFSSNGLLAVRIPPGAQRIELRYRDSAFILGAIVSVLTLLAALMLLGFERESVEQAGRRFGRSEPRFAPASTGQTQR